MIGAADLPPHKPRVLRTWELQPGAQPCLPPSLLFPFPPFPHLPLPSSFHRSSHPFSHLPLSFPLPSPLVMEVFWSLSSVRAPATNALFKNHFD